MNFCISNKRGFTIVELLVVVGIIGIIVGIIVPILSIARQKSKQIECVSNLRQLYIAIEQYTNDNGGLLPRPNNSGMSRDDTKKCSGEVWFKAVDNYLSSVSLPNKRDEISMEERLMFVKQDPIFKTLPVSDRDAARTIKMNWNLVSVSECQRTISTIDNPTKTILLFDGNIYNDTGKYSEQVANKFDGSHGSIAQRHSKAANILFMDGHVECIKNGNSDGKTNEGWPNKQAGQGLVWDVDHPDWP